MKKYILPALMVFATSTLAAQESVVLVSRARTHASLSGDLTLDLLSPGNLFVDTTSPIPVKDMPGYKSPSKAVLFSAVIPGAGQAYSERYWQGLAFFGAEVGLWVVYAVYQSKGNKQTDDFQAYADEHWSVVRYADWITQYASQLAPGMSVNTGGMVTNRDPNLPPWQQVDWSRINQVENQIMQSPDNGFTHNLPLRPAQQYYELIGKYWQFGPGWDSEVNMTPDDVRQGIISSQFVDYSKMRGRANDLYAIASTASYVLVANHVFSALEAAWAAAVNNRNLKMSATLEPLRTSGGIVEFVPVARMSVEF